VLEIDLRATSCIASKYVGNKPVSTLLRAKIKTASSP